MFLKEKTEAVVLGRQAISEADSQIILLTDRFGKLKAVARGERKILSKLRGGLGLFSWSEIELVFGYRQPIITAARPKTPFANLSRDWARFIVARKMTQDVEALTPWRLPDDNTWFLYLGALHALNLMKKHYQRLYYYFLWTLMNSWGYQIDLQKCARCSNHLKSEVCYLIAQDGIVCPGCRKDEDFLEKISPNTIKILRLIAEKDKACLARIKTSPEDQKNLEKVSRFFLDSVRQDQSSSLIKS
ncbi:MAG TPA: DNA repair protein RecO [Candidatus Pacearchaeota archaeon]|nr:DNA repair protein RecO [Candidatus Pacearchaeota archaeon]